MKKVFLCAILASLSYPAIASSLQDQLSAVAEAEQQGKNEEQRQHGRPTVILCLLTPAIW